MTTTRTPWREQASLAVIKGARRLFARTPIEKLALTTRIKARVFRLSGASGANGEITAGFRGLRLCVPANDVIMAPGLVGGYYEKLELDVFEQLAAVSQTIIDVGGNIGIYCCVAAGQASATSKIVTFEPVPENVRYLRRNLEENGQGARVAVEQQAVGMTSGSIELYLLAGSTCKHSASARNALDSTTSITVPAVSLDAYARQQLQHRPVELLKVDVEGYEGAVLRGARRTLREDKPTLFIEFVPGNLANCGFSPDEFLDLLFDAYDHVYLVDEPRATFRRCSRPDLLRYSARRVANANLIATSESSRPAHYQVIERISAALRPK